MTSVREVGVEIRLAVTVLCSQHLVQFVRIVKCSESLAEKEQKFVGFTPHHSDLFALRMISLCNTTPSVLITLDTK